MPRAIMMRSSEVIGRNAAGEMERRSKGNTKISFTLSNNESLKRIIPFRVVLIR